MIDPSFRWPPVSVVIPARHAEGLLDDCLLSVLSQDYPGELEVVVAVPPTDVATQKVVKGFSDPRVKTVANPSGTTPAGLNAAVSASQGEVVVRCDAQSRLPAGYLRSVVSLLAETGAGNVGGRQRPAASSGWQKAIALAMSSPLGAGDARYRVGRTAGPTDTVYLGAFLRKVLDEVGGFDESLERNQDYELNWRLRQAGYVVWFDPQLSVDYLPRRSLRALWRQYFDYGRWKREMLRRHPDSLRWRQVAPPLLVVGLAASALLAFTPARRLAVLLPAAYLAVLTIGGVITAVRRKTAEALLFPIVLPVMHLSWGWGFLRGIHPKADS